MSIRQYKPVSDTADQTAAVATPLIYANTVHAVGTAYDLSVDFAYRTSPDEQVPAAARIVMSWEHAASLVKVLGRMVEGYEQEVGKVRDIATIEDQARTRAEAPR